MEDIIDGPIRYVFLKHDVQRALCLSPPPCRLAQRGHCRGRSYCPRHGCWDYQASGLLRQPILAFYLDDHGKVQSDTRVGFCPAYHSTSSDFDQRVHHRLHRCLRGERLHWLVRNRHRGPTMPGLSWPLARPASWFPAVTPRPTIRRSSFLSLLLSLTRSLVTRSLAGVASCTGTLRGQSSNVVTVKDEDWPVELRFASLVFPNS